MLYNVICVICILEHKLNVCSCSLCYRSSHQVKGERSGGEKDPFVSAMLVSVLRNCRLSCWANQILCRPPHTSSYAPSGVPHVARWPPLPRRLALLYGKLIGTIPWSFVTRHRPGPGPPGCQGGYDNLCYRRPGRPQSQAHSIWKRETGRERGRDTNERRERFSIIGSTQLICGK